MSNNKFRRSGRKENYPFISRKDFSACHYLHKELPTDFYYVEVAKKVMVALFPLKNSEITSSILKELSLVLTHYLEDLVSGSGIWSAFISLCRKKYGRNLPFFIGEETENCNKFPTIGGIQFIIWYYLNSVRDDTLINPCNPFIGVVSVHVAEILTECYDEAPNTTGRPELISEDQSQVPLFYQVRNFCSWLCLKCYLTRIFDLGYIIDETVEIISSIYGDRDDDDNPQLDDQMDYGINSYIPFNSKIGPIGITPQEWLYEIVRCDPTEGEKSILPILAEIKSRPYSFYRYEKVEESSALLMGIDGTDYELSAYTLPDLKLPEGIKEGDSCLASLVYFNGKWNVNGISMMSMDPHLFTETRDACDKKNEEIKATYDYFMKITGNNPIGVAQDFNDLQTKLELPESDCIEDIDRDNWREILYYINTDSTVSVLPGFAPVVKFKGNKFYDKERASKEGVALIMNVDLSTPEFREYVVKHGMLADASMMSIESPEKGHRLFQDNLSFFLNYVNRETLVSGDI